MYLLKRIELLGEWCIRKLQNCGRLFCGVIISFWLWNSWAQNCEESTCFTFFASGCFFIKAERETQNTQPLELELHIYSTSLQNDHLLLDVKQGYVSGNIQLGDQVISSDRKSNLDSVWFPDPNPCPLLHLSGYKFLITNFYCYRGTKLKESFSSAEFMW